MASRPPIGAGGDAPRLEIPVVADLAPFERVIQQDLPRRARDAGKRAAHALAEGISDRTGMQDRMKRIASQSVDDFVDSALAWLKRRQAEIQEEVARGFIDEKKADEMGRRAERAFNDRILRELDRRAASGRLSNQDYLGLAGALKRTAERGVENMKTPFERFQRWMRAGFAAGLIGAAAYAFSRVVSMARSAARAIQGVLTRGSEAVTAEEGFQALASRRGLSADTAIDALRRGTLGQVSDLELMQRANLALLSSLPLTERSLERIAVVSRRLGQVVGKDATEAFGYFIRAIETGQSDMLKQIGITTTLEGALRRYRQRTGESTEGLSEQQRVLILYNEVMEEAERKVAAMGEETITAGQRIQQFTTFLSNLKTASEEAIAQSPRIVEFLDNLGTNAEQSADKVEIIALRIGAVTDALLDLADVGQRVGARPLIGLLSRMPLSREIFQGAGFLLARSDEHFQRRLEEAAAETSTNRAISDIRGETSIEALQARARENQRRARQADKQDAETWLRLHREQLAILERMQELRAGGDPEVPDPRRIKQARDELEQFRRSLLADAERNLEDLQKLRDAALLVGDEEALARINPLLHNAQREVARLNQIVAQMPELFARIKPAVQTSVEGLVPLRIDAARFLQAFENDYSTMIGRLREARERGILSEEEFKKQEEAAAEEFNERLLGLIDRLREMGALSDEVYRLLTGAFKDSAEDTDSLAKNLRAVAGVARGVLSVADAVGKIGDNARRSLQGIVDLVDGISAMRTATDMVGKISGGVTAIGGAIGLLSAVFGESAAQRANREAMQRNTRAIDALRLELAGFRATATNITAARRAIDAPGLATLFSMGGIHRNIAQDELERRLAMFGSSMEELAALAEKYGIDIFDDKGRIVGSRLEQLAAQLRQAERALVGWRDTVDDQRARMELEADVFDLEDDPFTRLQREMDLLRKFAPGLVPAGADPSTPEGRAAIEAMLRELITRFSLGSLDLGNLTREEFLELIRSIEGLLDEVEGGVVGGDGSVRLGVSITEVQASRMLSELSTQTYYLSKIATAVAGPVLAGAPPALPTLSAVNAPTTISIGDIAFNFPNVRGPLTEAAARRAGAAAGDGLRQQLAAAHHAAGAQGTPRILTRTEG